MIDLKLDSIPQELKSSRRWVRGARCDVRQPDGTIRKNCKPLFDTKTGELAKVNDPNTWSTSEETIAAHNEGKPLYQGPPIVTMYDERYVGVVAGPPWCFGDADDCRNPETGELTPEGREMVDLWNTYTEISPSETGLRFVLHGEPPDKAGKSLDPAKNNGCKIEFYSTAHWLTLTGNVLPGHEEIRRADSGEVKKIYERHSAKTSSAILEARGKSHGTIEELMTRIDFPDLNPVVQSLLTQLAVKHTCNREKIEAEFKQSKLYLETHWNGKWGVRREEELNLAIRHAEENIQKRLTRGKQEVEPEKTSLVMPDACMTRRRPERWIWNPVLLEAGMLNLSGMSSQGKSPLVIDLLARMTKLPGQEGAGLWPDGQKMARYPMPVILLNNEDDLESRILPYFDEAGGCSMFFHPITGVQVEKGDKLHQRMLALKEDITLICAEARKLAPHLGAIAIDPVTNYLGKLKMNQEEDVREALMPLVQLQQELRFNVITVSHLNKGEGDPMSRVMGARAFVGVARTAWQCNDDDEVEGHYAHIMSPVRGKMGHGSFKYHTEAVKVEIDGEPSEVIKVVWDGMSKSSAAQALDPDNQRNKSKVKEAGVVLRDFLKSGARTSEECLSTLKGLGFDMEKLNSGRVRKAAGALFRLEGRSSEWYLPTAQQGFAIPPARKDDGAPTF